MIDFGKWAFSHRKLVYFLLAVLIVGGLRSAYDMGKLEDPEIKVKLAMVVGVRPGASAHEMELEVTDPLEKAIRTLGDVSNTQSWSQNDLCIIQVELKSTTPDERIEQCWDMLRHKVSDVGMSLPDGTTVRVQDDFGLVYGMFYALTDDGFGERELSDYASLVQRELTDLDGVARVELYGKREESIDISLRADKLAALGISPAEVLATLNGQHGTFYAGYYDNGDKRVRVTVADKSHTVEQIRDMIIQGHEDDQLRLGDIATVESGYAEPVRNSMTRNGERAIGIAVAAASGTDIVKVGKAVERKLAELHEARFPAGIACHKVFYQPERVTDALSTFFINLVESVLIVILILMVTMGFRSGVIIGFSLLTIVIGTFLLLGMTYINNLILMFTLSNGGVLPPALDSAVRGLAAVPVTAYLWALFERIPAVAFHMSASVLVFAAAKQPGKLWLFPAAILLHALLDFTAIVCNAYLPLPALELLITVFALAVVWLGYRVYNNLQKNQEIS